jgi:uncharacterized membrane protein YfcA
MSTHDLLILSAVLGAGAFVEAVAGFGGTILALSIGARWFGIEELLAWFLPLNMGLSTALALRGRHAIAGRLLARRILPTILAGLAGGTALAYAIDAERARGVFAALVIAVAVVELASSLRPTRAAPSTPMRPAVQGGLLLGAGVVHGVFATGGPLAVAVIGRMLPTKAALRSTLAVMWFVLNVIVSARLAARGHLDGASLRGSLLLIPAMAAGMLLGDLVHRRVSEGGFRQVVAVLLLVTGGLLLQAALG